LVGDVPDPATPADGDAGGMTDQTPLEAPTRPRLVRSRDDRLIAGVCGGVARWSGLDVALVRIVVVLLAVFGGSGLLVYVLGWLLIPDEGAEQTEADRILHGLRR
jgi:phage shock protein PspC (stress-responsive transcriptional regulator)